MFNLFVPCRWLIIVIVIRVVVVIIIIRTVFVQCFFVLRSGALCVPVSA